MSLFWFLIPWHFIAGFGLTPRECKTCSHIHLHLLKLLDFPVNRLPTHLLHLFTPGGSHGCRRSLHPQDTSPLKPRMSGGGDGLEQRLGFPPPWFTSSTTCCYTRKAVFSQEPHSGGNLSQYLQVLAFTNGSTAATTDIFCK